MSPLNIKFVLVIALVLQEFIPLIVVIELQPINIEVKIVIPVKFKVPKTELKVKFEQPLK